MTRQYVIIVMATLSLAPPPPAHADVRAEEKTHVEFAGMLGHVINAFAGKAAREGVASTVAVKGDRKATFNDTTGQIIDLDEEKVYDLDMEGKTYKVTTFAEFRRQMEEAQRKAEEEARREQSEQPAEERQPNEQTIDVEVDFDVQNTGQAKVINGFDTRQSVMTITVRKKGMTLEQGGGIVITSDVWLTPKIAAMQDLNDFDRRYAAKLYGPMVNAPRVTAPDMAAAVAMYPMLKQAIGRMTVEGDKLEGTPVLTTMTFDAVRSAEQMAQEAKQRGEDEKVDASGGIRGILGGLAGRAMKKKVQGESKPRTTIMTSTSEVLKVTTDVSAEDVRIPAGFKEMKKSGSKR
jgi:hypothetical protein